MSTAAETTSLGLDPDAQRVIEERRARRLSRLARRDRATLIISAGLFVVAAGAMAAFIPSERSPSLFSVGLLVVLYAVTFRFEFEVGTGVAVPTQLFLVPMLFLLPTGWVPLAVAAGIILGSLVSYVRAELGLGRVFVRVVNAWHAVGPALVLGLAGEGPPSLEEWPLYTAALAAQFLFDFASAAAREWAVLGVPPRIQLRAMTLVYLIDFGLAPVGLAVAFASQGNPAGVLLRCRSSSSSASSRRSARFESTTSSSCATPTAAPPSCSET